MTLPYRGIGWLYDLPSSDKPLPQRQTISNLDPPPNHIDQSYIELPRSLLRARGVGLVAGGLALLLGAAVIIHSLTFDFFIIGKVDPSDSIILMAMLFGGCFLFTPFIRLELSLPRDEPIRFNRYRRKVYFYQFRLDRLRPFSRKNWGVQPVAYDWEDLTAEVYRFYAPLGYGGYKEEVRISVRKPGTEEVIDRLFFTDDIQTGKQYWDIARLFMHEGAEALPEFVHSPWNWNEGTYSNPFDQRAPKVQWPADMDLESRTAPNPGDRT
ncbi:DUF6708 domain-containing protein [Pseudomonas sp. NPDC089428]|uniref:DUF6708 domain-containing protein n=1 Tax=Pseudomonas sp. NPDC089428 TaxID=3364467 RepID=UPI0037FA94AA